MVPDREKWRISYLTKLLMERGQNHYEGGDVEQLTVLIDSLCTTKTGFLSTLTGEEVSLHTMGPVLHIVKGSVSSLYLTRAHVKCCIVSSNNKQ